MAASPPARLTLLGLNDRLRAFEGRLSAIESEHVAAASEHATFRLADQALEHVDSLTAMAVDELTKAIKDPEIGLIVGLREFRTEVRNDRRVTRAYIAGAIAVVSAIWALLLAFAPTIHQLFLGA